MPPIVALLKILYYRSEIHASSLIGVKQLSQSYTISGPRLFTRHQYNSFEQPVNNTQRISKESLVYQTPYNMPFVFNVYSL